MTLKILPHGRLQEWVAEEQGYFAAEGLEDTFLPEGDYGVLAGQVGTGAFETSLPALHQGSLRRYPGLGLAASSLPSPKPPPTTRQPWPSPEHEQHRMTPRPSGSLAASSGARAWLYPGSYPGRTGGPWLCRTLVLFLFHALVVPSGFTTRTQPQR